MIIAAVFAAMTLYNQDPVPEWTQLPVGHQELATQYARLARDREGYFQSIWLVTVLKDPAPGTTGPVYGYEYVVSYNCTNGLRTVERKVALLQDGTRAEWLPVADMRGPVPANDAEQAAYRFACPFRQDWPKVSSDTAGLLNRR